MAKVCCSIEMEPKTLNEVQLHQAREVAADVVQKLEPSEASVVFVDGLSPIISIKENKMGEEEKLELEKWKEKSENYEGRICQCSCVVSIANSESPDQLQQLPQPLSAPF